ncbi:MAG: oxidoreductase [Thermoanaerobaculia bacterium]|jgi:NAD(P)-dependent dehydrogenase (short-subunit alcohol dehydrogenase family)
MSRWTLKNLADQTDRVVIVTGANTGIGFETAAAFAARNAEVVLACRSEAKAVDAMKRIRFRTPLARLRFIALDLASLDSIARFAKTFRDTYPRLDLLINNAGVMIPPLGYTADRFELQFGCNHLGHFALTGQLLGLLEATPSSRVVNVSSIAHKYGAIDFENLNAEQGYDKSAAYSQSKLANLLFTRELQSRLRAAGSKVIVTAAHPGWTATDLQRHNLLFRMLNPLFSQAPPQGALPTIRAAVDDTATGGEYFGPRGWFETRGLPERADMTAAAKNDDDARRLWQVSERLTGVRYLGQPANAA